MNALENFQRGFQAARTVESTPPSVTELPIQVASKSEFLTKFAELEKTMRIEPLPLDDAYKLLLEGNMPWRFSPESRLAHLYAEQSQVGKFNVETKGENLEAWRELKPLHHEHAVKRSKELWQTYKNQAMQIENSGREIVGSPRTSIRLAVEIQNHKKDIDVKAQELISKKPTLSYQLARSQAIDTILGQPFIDKSTNKIKATKAYYHGKKLADRANYGSEVVALQEKIADEIPKSSFKIGAVDGSGQPLFFEMAMIKNVTIDAKTGKEKWFAQGLVIQEPAWTEQQRKNRPVGLAILPWFEAYYEAPAGDVYVNIGLRNEPGADNYSTSVTGEQTSGTKMVKGDILNQPGGAIIAVCVGEKLAVHCEQVPELTDAIDENNMDAALANRDGNRMGNGHNAYAALKIEDGSPLLKQYAKNMWIKLTDLEELIDETNTDHPIVNDLLLAAKDQLNRRLRLQAEARDRAKTELLRDIATNPASAFGWFIAAQLNWLENKIK